MFERVFVNRKTAIAHGFTHEAWFSGLPCWAKDVDTDNPLVVAKMPLMDYVLPWLAALQGMFYPTFVLKLAEIEVPDGRR